VIHSFRSLRTAAVALVLLVVAAGCSKDTTSSSSSTEPSTAPTSESTSGAPSSETDSSTPSMVFSSGSETVSIGGGDIPEGFPSEFPIPDGATVVYSASAGGSYSIWFSSDASMDEQKSFFDEQLPANGWDSQSFDFGDQNGAYRAYTITGNGYSGGVYVGEGAPGSDTFSGDFSFFVVLSPE